MSGKCKLIAAAAGRLTLAACMLAMFAGVPDAVAGEQEARLVLMPLQVAKTDRALANNLEAAFVEGLSQHYAVYSGERVAKVASAAQRHHPVARNRHSKRAHRDAARSLREVASAFRARLVASADAIRDGQDYFIALLIQDSWSGRAVYSRSLTCQGCGPAQAIDRIRHMLGMPAAAQLAAADNAAAENAAEQTGVENASVEKTSAEKTSATKTMADSAYVSADDAGADITLAADPTAANGKAAGQAANDQPMDHVDHPGADQAAAAADVTADDAENAALTDPAGLPLPGGPALGGLNTQADYLLTLNRPVAQVPRYRCNRLDVAGNADGSLRARVACKRLNLALAGDAHVQFAGGVQQAEVQRISGNGRADLRGMQIAALRVRAIDDKGVAYFTVGGDARVSTVNGTLYVRAVRGIAAPAVHIGLVQGDVHWCGVKLETDEVREAGKVVEDCAW